MFCRDDLRREFDGRKVFLLRDVGGARFGRFATPVGATGGCVERVGPGYLDAAGGGREGLDAALSDGLVEFRQKAVR